MCMIWLSHGRISERSPHDRYLATYDQVRYNVVYKRYACCYYHLFLIFFYELDVFFMQEAFLFLGRYVLLVGYWTLYRRLGEMVGSMSV